MARTPYSFAVSASSSPSTGPVGAVVQAEPPDDGHPGRVGRWRRVSGRSGARDRCSSAGAGLLRRTTARIRATSFAQTEGLAQVVVGPELETDHTVDLVAARADDHDGLTRRPGAQRPADVEPVHVGQPEIEQDHVGGPRREGIGTVATR